MSASLRKFVLERDDFKCQYCGYGPDSRDLQVHHIVYESEGGPDDPDNLITLCKKHHGLLHGLGESGDSPTAVLEENDIPKDWPDIRGLDSPVKVLLLDVLKDGRKDGRPWGYATVKRLGEEADLRKQYVNREVEGLLGAGWIEKPYRGLYKFVRDPREADDETETISNSDQ